MVKRDKNGRFIKGSKFWEGKKRPELKSSTQFKKNSKPWNYGIKMSKEHCKKLSESQNLVKHPNARGKKHYNFKDGKYSGLRTVEFKKWRDTILKRDKYVCQHCHEKNIPLDVHHIKSKREYPELIYDINNGITLCKICHRKTSSYGRPKLIN